MFGYCVTFDVQGWLDSGLAVIQVNPPGSTGYGFDFARAVWGDWGGTDFDYQMAAIDHCIEQGWVDPERLAVTGTSYGGFMVNRTIARTDRFRCAVTENGTSDFFSAFGTSDFGLLYDRPHLGGLPWRQPEKYFSLSPIRYVADVRTPVLILLAEEDHRQPSGQAEEWFTALIVEGKNAVLVRYPHDSHFMRVHGRPSNRVHRLRRVRSWLAQHLGTDPPAG
jgi:dipeptidyl aminopeptidase/acylaminoacyl peptidase